MKKDQRGAFGAIEIALIAVLIAFTGFVVWRINSADEVVNDAQANTVTSADSVPLTNSAPADETSAPAEEAPAASDVETTTLSAVGNYTGDGTATRSYVNDSFTHEVVANLDDPAEGKFYEGWLVSQNDFISTGRMTQEEPGVWTLVYTSDEDLRDLNMVTITEETEANGLDNIPEDHVLEGSF